MDTKNMDTYCIGHVLRILDERTIIISAGNSTIAKGASIQVYEITDILKDLNGDDLDVIIHIKETLQVVQTENKYSICKKMEQKPVAFTLALSPLLEQKSGEYSPLNVDQNDIKPLQIKDPLVRVGDPVKFA